MAGRSNYSYQVRQVNEKKGFGWSKPSGTDAMAEINGCGVIIAFFIVVCGSGCALWLLRHAMSGAGAVTFVFSVVLMVVLLGVMSGMAWATLRQFWEQDRKEAVVVTAISFTAAAIIGAAIGLSVPLTMVMM